MSEKPWTEADTQAWLETLGSSRAKQVEVIKHLLDYASEDEMSAEDRTICLNTLKDMGVDYPESKTVEATNPSDIVLINN